MQKGLIKPGFTIALVSLVHRSSSHTNWFHVTAFGKVAEKAKAGLKKGSRIAVHGRMKVSKFTDRSGEERNGFEILADEVALWKSLPSHLGEVSGAEEQDEHAVDKEETKAAPRKQRVVATQPPPHQKQPYQPKQGTGASGVRARPAQGEQKLGA